MVNFMPTCQTEIQTQIYLTLSPSLSFWGSEPPITAGNQGLVARSLNRNAAERTGVGKKSIREGPFQPLIYDRWKQIVYCVLAFY